jgi:UDP-3-O-[3-hydroxymyristoyl] glucosamine N-acyltransferase
MPIELAELCARFQLPRPEGATVSIEGLSPLESTCDRHLCFAEKAEQREQVAACGAAAVLVPEDFPQVGNVRLIRVDQPRRLFFRIAELFVPQSDLVGVHEDAVIDPDATLAPDCAVGACAVVSATARIGDRTTVAPGAYIGPGVSIGADCAIGPNVAVLQGTRIGDRCTVHAGACIGGDGFGFHWDGDAHRKVPQIGRVVIEDDCEIGCNSCVDRATLGETRIGRGTKIDNLVQVAHNVDVGRHVILVSQTGIAGSTRVGDGVIAAGQVAISDHLEIGAGARIGGQAGVTKDVPAATAVWGTPARPMKQQMKEQAAVARLPKLRGQVQQLQDLAAKLQERLSRLEAERSD